MKNEKPVLAAECHFEIKQNYHLETRSSKVDESFIDYFLESETGAFAINFDVSLYVPPQIVLDLEEELEKQIQSPKTK